MRCGCDVSAVYSPIITKLPGDLLKLAPPPPDQLSTALLHRGAVLTAASDFALTLQRREAMTYSVTLVANTMIEVRAARIMTSLLCHDGL